MQGLVTGLWQVADQERTAPLDIGAAAEALCAYARDGFDTFDMADHYGSAELIAGEARRRLEPELTPRLYTKWCPAPGPMTRDVVRRGIDERLTRLGVERLDLLQLHWWTFEHPAYLDAMEELVRAQQDGLIDQLGVTNFDAEHLHLLARHGFPIATNQVCLSVLDRRALGAMQAVCSRHGIELLAYGTLAGGFLAERYVEQPQPAGVDDWSRMKYARFIDAAGGWAAFQSVLRVLAAVARRHGASVSNVATRWVMDRPHVQAAIVGARLGERDHRDANLRLAALTLSETDRTDIEAALGALAPIPGDCGTEYRRPPFLTASGDLSHHLDTVEKFFTARPVPGREARSQIDSASEWESVCGYCRALRVGDRILVSGTTATHGAGTVICPGDARGQAVYILDKILAAVTALGGRLEDVVRTRVYLADADDWEAVSRAHGHYFGQLRPANTLLEVSRLVGDYLVEIEAEAVV